VEEGDRCGARLRGPAPGLCARRWRSACDAMRSSSGRRTPSDAASDTVDAYPQRGGYPPRLLCYLMERYNDHVPQRD
jgi:hypothetical protein